MTLVEGGESLAEAAELSDSLSNIPKYIGEVVSGGVDSINDALDKLNKASAVVSKQLTEVVSISHEELLKEASLISSIPVMLKHAEQELDDIAATLKNLQNLFPPKQEKMRKSLERWSSLVETLNLLYQAQNVVQQLAATDQTHEARDLSRLEPHKCRQAAANLAKTLERLADDNVRMSLAKITKLQQPIKFLMAKSSELRKIGSQLCRPFAENHEGSSPPLQEIHDLRCGLHILYYVNALSEELTVVHSAILQPLEQLLNGEVKDMLKVITISSKILQKGVVLDHALSDIYEGKNVWREGSSERSLWKEILALCDFNINRIFGRMRIHNMNDVQDVLKFQDSIDQLQNSLSQISPATGEAPKLAADRSKLEAATNCLWKEITAPLGQTFPHMNHLLTTISGNSSLDFVNEQCELAIRHNNMVRNMPAKKDMAQLISSFIPILALPRLPLVLKVGEIFCAILICCFRSSFPMSLGNILSLEGSLKPISRVHTTRIQAYQLVDFFVSSIETQAPPVKSLQLLKSFREELIDPWLQEIAQFVMGSIDAAISLTETEREAAHQILDTCRQSVQQVVDNLLQPLTQIPHFQSFLRSHQLRCLRHTSLNWLTCMMSTTTNAVQHEFMAKIIGLLQSMTSLDLTELNYNEFDALEDLMRLTCGDLSVIPEIDKDPNTEIVLFLRNPSKLRPEIIAYYLLSRLPNVNKADLVDLNSRNASVLRTDLLSTESLVNEDFQADLNRWSTNLQKNVIQVTIGNVAVLQACANDDNSPYYQKSANFLLSEFSGQWQPGMQPPSQDL